MKCIDCLNYFRGDKNRDSYCFVGGNVTNPEEDINCVEAGDEELEG